MSSMFSKALPALDAKVSEKGMPKGVFSALFNGKLGGPFKQLSQSQPQAEAPKPEGVKNANYQSASGYRASYRSRRSHQQGLLGAGTDMES